MRVGASPPSLNLSPALETTLSGKSGNQGGRGELDLTHSFIHPAWATFMQVSGEMDPSGTKPRDADDRPADRDPLGICHLHSPGH